jgi:hypothetical protein
MIRDLNDLAYAAAIGGALVLGACSGDEEPKESGDTAATTGCPTTGCPTTGCPNTGCPTTGCPTTGCPTTGCPTTGCPTTSTGPGAFAPDFETSADFFTLMAGPVDGGSVHEVVQIWYSTNARTLIESGGAFTAPVGTVAIKPQTNSAGDAIVVMIKQPAGYDPANGDWLYEQRDAAGALVNSGPLAGCIACHVGWPDTDYLAGTELR